VVAWAVFWGQGCQEPDGPGPDQHRRVRSEWFSTLYAVLDDACLPAPEDGIQELQDMYAGQACARFSYSSRWCTDGFLAVATLKCLLGSWRWQFKRCVEGLAGVDAQAHLK